MEENASPQKDVFDKMAEAWPAPGFVRTETEKFTGGLLSRKTLANLQSLGEGPPIIKLRGKAFMDKWAFVDWFRRYCNKRAEG